MEVICFVLEKNSAPLIHLHSLYLSQRIPGVIKFSPFFFSSLLDLYSFRCYGACASPIVCVLVNDLCVCLAAFSVTQIGLHSISFFLFGRGISSFSVVDVWGFNCPKKIHPLAATRQAISSFSKILFYYFPHLTDAQSLSLLLPLGSSNNKHFKQ